MRRLAALLPIVLALGAIILASVAGARADARAEGPTGIEKCQTISNPGSYKLVSNLTATGDCLLINADFVTVDLAGFTISGNGAGISSSQQSEGIAVRNGTIVGGFGGVAHFLVQALLLRKCGCYLEWAME